MLLNVGIAVMTPSVSATLFFGCGGVGQTSVAFSPTAMSTIISFMCGSIARRSSSHCHHAGGRAGSTDR
jgi:hypothetical protein